MSKRSDSISTPPALGVATESSGQALKRRRREQTFYQIGKQFFKGKGKEEKAGTPELPDELWAKIFKSVSGNSAAAFAVTCKQMRRVQEESEFGNLTTTLRGCRVLANPDGLGDLCMVDPPAVIAAWFRWAWSLTTAHDGVKRLHYGKFERAFSTRQVLPNIAAYWGFLTELDELEGQNSFCSAPYGEDICHSAAQGNQLKTLIWAHQHGCPWDPTCCRIAAAKGHLDVLKYLHENGCP